ncbi:MAG TPA: lecithin retinol acyltransferase family protein [bacterium]|nr:lecithin retinol acyltransferase family protein [bacterium]
MSEQNEKYEKGSILKRKIWYTFFFYHVGIYVGNGEVVEFDRRRKGSDNSVKKNSLEHFSQGKEPKVHVRPKNKQHSEQILSRTSAALEHPYLIPRYVLFNNCEDFAEIIYGPGYPRSQRKYVLLLIILYVFFRYVVKSNIEQAIAITVISVLMLKLSRQIILRRFSSRMSEKKNN